MRLLSKFFTFLLFVALFAGCKDHDLYEVIEQKGLPLSGRQEVPQNGSPAVGIADVSYNKNTKMLTYTITFSNLTGIPTVGHIHGTTPRGANASVKHDFSMLIPKATSGTFTNSVLVDGIAINEEDLLNGLYYFNIHTPQFPGGEIRGQIEFYDQSFIVSKKGIPLSGLQEVPPNASTATGSVDVTYNKKTKRLSYFITWNNLTGTPTGAHIHGPAPVGVNASVKHNFFPLIPLTPSGAFSNSVVVDGISIDEAGLLNGQYYFNIHTPTYPGGEIRGQIVF